MRIDAKEALDAAALIADALTAHQVLYPGPDDTDMIVDAKTWNRIMGYVNRFQELFPPGSLPATTKTNGDKPQPTNP